MRPRTLGFASHVDALCKPLPVTISFVVHALSLLYFSPDPGSAFLRCCSASMLAGVTLAMAVAQFIRICRWLQLIYKDRLAPLENAPFSMPWARKRYRVAQRSRQY